ncbi:bifunctional DNA primase/polymerase [Streptomyces griseoruber]|uniref:bifunctional DNA primase/polymerase n=1 Tax=Streptomyces griseoruber TaxID=1943 RepID=UPI003790C4A6
MAYALAGVRVFRVRRDKAPYANCMRCDKNGPMYLPHTPEQCRCGVDTCHGFHAATTDPRAIEKWWIEEPEANIGAPCRLNGWAVIDIDPRNDGHKSLCAVEERIGALPGTTTQITGGHGLHLLYRSPGIDLPREPFPGFEFKHHHYIQLAPSMHSSGIRYQWAGDGKFYFPCTPWPRALIPKRRHTTLSDPVPIGSRPIPVTGNRDLDRVQEIAGKVRRLPEGDATNSCYQYASWIGQYVGEGKVDEMTAWALLESSVQDWSYDSPKGERGIADALRNGFRWGIDNPRQGEAR